jgi:MFS transporter, MHS family, proline/betaine transporter
MSTTANTTRGGSLEIRRVRRAGAIGNFIEYFDNALYGIFAVTIAKLFFPTFDPIAGLLSTFALFGVSFVVRPVGAIIFGHIGDRWGRKPALIGSVLMMSSATAIVGLLPTYSTVGALAPLLLLVCRLLQGFSTGGEATTVWVLVTEHSPVAERGRSIGPMASSAVCAIGLTALTAMITRLAASPEQVTGWVWRVPFLLAIPLGIVGLWLRLKIDDAEVYKSASEVSAIINKDIETGEHHLPIVQAFRKMKKEMLVLFLWGALSATSGYIAISYMATQLIQFEKYSPASAYGIVAVALLIGAVVSIWLGCVADKVARKRFAMANAAGFVVWSLPTFLLIGHGVVLAGIAFTIFTVFVCGTMIVAGLAVVELFPVDVRASAAAVPHAVSFAAFGGTAPFIATWLASTFSPIAPAFYLIVVAVVAFFVGWLGIPNAREMAVVSDDHAELKPTSEHEQRLGRSPIL